MHMEENSPFKRARCRLWYKEKPSTESNPITFMPYKGKKLMEKLKEVNPQKYKSLSRKDSPEQNDSEPKKSDDFEELAGGCLAIIFIIGALVYYFS